MILDIYISVIKTNYFIKSNSKLFIELFIKKYLKLLILLFSMFVNYF